MLFVDYFEDDLIVVDIIVWVVDNNNCFYEVIGIVVSNVLDEYVLIVFVLSVFMLVFGDVIVFLCIVGVVDDFWESENIGFYGIMFLRRFL